MARRELTGAERQAAANLLRLWNEKKDALGLTQEAAAFQLGFRTQGAVSHYLHARAALNTDAVLKFARLLGVRPAEIDSRVSDKFAGVAEPVAFYGESGTEYELVTRVKGALLSAGPGRATFEHEEIDSSHSFRKDWMRKRGLKRERCRIMEVSGDSMSPYLNPGDVVLIDLDDNQRILDGKVYAIAVHDEAMIKRLFKRPGGAIEISSDNPRWKPQIIEADKLATLVVIGRMRWHSGED